MIFLLKNNAAAGSPLAIRSWYHLVGVRVGDYIKLYVDGVLADSEYVGAAVVNTIPSRDIFLGLMGNGKYLEVGFDEFVVYHRALSDTEVEDLYDLGCNDFTAEGEEGELASGGYRYGFNGMEKDDEVKGQGNHIDFGARGYDPRLGRFLSVDALDHKYPFWTPYSMAGNIPISFGDKGGNDVVVLIWNSSAGDQGHVAIAIENWEKIDGKLTSTGTYTLYEASALETNDISSFIKNPSQIVEGKVLRSKPMSLEQLKDYKSTGSKSNGIYKIQTDGYIDQASKKVLDSDVTKFRSEVNPDYDPYSSEGDNPYMVSKAENPISYSLIKSDDCNVISCAGLVSRTLAEQYGFNGDVGLENINTDPASVSGRDVPKISANAYTPNFLARDLNRLSKDPNSGVSKISQGSFSDFSNSVSGGQIPDKTPGK